MAPLYEIAESFAADLQPRLVGLLDLVTSAPFLVPLATVLVAVTAISLLAGDTD